jgi:hypothetical protein
MSGLLRLPPEMLLKITEYLPPKDILAFGSTSQKNYAIAMTRFSDLNRSLESNPDYHRFLSRFTAYFPEEADNIPLRVITYFFNNLDSRKFIQDCKKLDLRSLASLIHTSIVNGRELKNLPILLDKFTFSLEDYSWFLESMIAYDRFDYIGLLPMETLPIETYVKIFEKMKTDQIWTLKDQRRAIDVLSPYYLDRFSKFLARFSRFLRPLKQLYLRKLRQSFQDRFTS